MKKTIMFLAMTIVLSAASIAAALDSAALVGKWQLVENALNSEGDPCPFVGKQIEFTSDGKMISANMPMPFKYKVNPSRAEAEAATMRFPELKGMEIMLAAMGNSQTDWSRAPIVYGVQLSNKEFSMKVSGYTPARYKKLQ